MRGVEKENKGEGEARGGEEEGGEEEEEKKKENERDTKK